jgi:chromosomal replication initiator protein
MDKIVTTTGDVSPVYGKIWPETKALLSGKISKEMYKTWIEPLSVKWKGDEIEIISPNEFFLKYIISHYKSEIEQSVSKLCKELSLTGISVTFSFTEEPALSSIPGYENDGSLFGSQIKGSGFRGLFDNQSPSYSLNPTFTFENFVVGSPNNLAFSATKAFSEDQKLGPRMLFLLSEHGLGKSHLSQALGHLVLIKKPQNKVIYLTAEDFANEMVKSLNDKNMQDFKRRFRVNCDILILEGVTFLSGKSKIQEELSLTLDFLTGQGKKVVLTSTIEPKSIPNLEKSLKSRFNSSLLAPIGPPDYDTRVKILKRKAAAENLNLNNKVLELIAAQITTDVRILEASITTIAARSRFLNQPPTISMARECLTIYPSAGEGGVTLDRIKQFICATFNLAEDDLTSNSRLKKVCEARKIGIYLSRLLTKNTLEEIGKKFGRRHSSVLYAFTQVEREIKADSRFSRQMDFFIGQLSIKH